MRKGIIFSILIISFLIINNNAAFPQINYNKLNKQSHDSITGASNGMLEIVISYINPAYDEPNPGGIALNIYYFSNNTIFFSDYGDYWIITAPAPNKYKIQAGFEDKVITLNPNQTVSVTFEIDLGGGVAGLEGLYLTIIAIIGLSVILITVGVIFLVKRYTKKTLKRCSNCGLPFSPNDIICPNCGRQRYPL